MLETLIRRCGVGVAVAALSFNLSACSGLDAGVRTMKEPPGPNCEFGGLKVLTGQDENDNGVLDESEADGVEYVCNQRVDGKTSLVDVNREEPGSNCENGGIRVDFGPDDDGDYELSASEIKNTEYVCNGRNLLLDIVSLAAGGTCAQGGIEVRAGYDLNANGALEAGEVDLNRAVCHGDASLVKVDEVSAGSQCAAGGIKIANGFDKNGNRALDASEVQGTEFVCNGEDGANSLVKLVDLPADPAGACFFGGTRVESGLDTNGDNELGAAEVVSTQDLCSVQVNQFMTLVRNSAILPGSVCTYGGVKIEVGIDDNDNHVLEASEVDSTADQCSSAIIIDGLTTLTNTGAATSAQCAFGGIILRSGVDDDRDGTLDAAEYDDVDLICNGANGYNGVSRTELYSGAVCESGAGIRLKSGLDLNRNDTLDDAEVKNETVVCDGAAGWSGKDSLIRASDAGSACGSYGGVRFDVGTDEDGDRSLDLGEIESTGYVCNGYDGYNALVELFDDAGACGGFGGSRIEVGLDLDGDLGLDSSEVTQFSYVCNGADGYSAAVESEENFWLACGDAWGVRILTGLDRDFDGYLDSSEVQYENYVCEPSI